MLRCIRLYTDEHGQSQAQAGHLHYQEAERGDITTAAMPAEHIVFKETPAGTQSEWHVDAGRHLVLTLKGQVRFETKAGAHFEVQCGDLLLAEESGGLGHRWQIVGPEPWVRAYIQLPTEANIPFVAQN